MIFEMIKGIDKKQDEQSEQINLIKIDVAKNTQDLSYHIFRTNALQDLTVKFENNCALHKSEMQKSKDENDSRLSALELPGKSFGLIVKVTTGLTVIIALVASFLRIK